MAIDGCILWHVILIHYSHVLRAKFTLIKEQSKFVDWQRIKVQENADEVIRDGLWIYWFWFGLFYSYP